MLQVCEPELGVSYEKKNGGLTVGVALTHLPRFVPSMMGGTRVTWVFGVAPACRVLLTKTCQFLTTCLCPPLASGVIPCLTSLGR